MLLDQLVGLLTAHARLHGGHQHPGGGEERQVAPEFTLHDRRVDAELVEHGEESLEEAVDGEEGVRQGHPPYDRATHVTLVPLVSDEATHHGQMAPQHDGEAVDPFTRPCVHLVGHRRRTDLSGAEALGGQLVAGHQPDGAGQVGRTAGGLGQGRDHVEVQRPRVHLPDRIQHLLEAQVLGHQPFKAVDPVAITQ